jgi:hypothetical protein
MIDAEKTALGFSLKCPHCGGTNLHHDEVVVFERLDCMRQGTRVMVAGVDRQAQDGVAGLFPCVTIDAAMVDNPSPRRQGVHVGLWCEQCGQRSSLSIVQHKGETYLECSRSFVGPNVELHRKILGFLRDVWERKANQLIGVALLYAPGNGFKDEEIREWIRDDDPELFAKFVDVEELVTQLVAISEGEADAHGVGKHHFIVRAHQHMAGYVTYPFALLREAPGS